ncbi:MBL fold metallo-hydrolase [Paenibacillus sp. 481]|uniref:MBL fold metallo-hydrolase n=1 Tax=Paenibacillus sp. 481 TaxID=2835869 RepID=UPI001E5E1B53|nr:MBL fold metallo-hydrolase [Paenibacillus sp. 481]UHA75508.1 MBL fold metallo-hydrolase [Paenibacillus sp. 481]
MFIRSFYNDGLSQLSYLVGCQKTGEAMVVDPIRDVYPYLELAKAEGFTITAVAETHIHADYVSGALELGKAHGATLYLSDEGDENWKYGYVKEVNHRLLKDGDHFQIGNIHVEVWHTPGHTPESLSFLLTDKGGGANEPMGIFTGDFVFVGDVGRPDLLEKAVGLVGTAAVGASQMFASLQKFKQLPEYLQIWPAHGAGSACGKALGAVHSSTIGYEKRFNWALSHTEEEAFIEALLEGQSEPPSYFARMKQINKEGPGLLSSLPELKNWDTAIMMLPYLIENGAIVLDARSASQFAQGHIVGSFNIPYHRSLTNWAGSLLSHERATYLLVDQEHVLPIVRQLRAVGIDQIIGFIHADLLQSTQDYGFTQQTYREVNPQGEDMIADRIAAKEVYVIDVRSEQEWREGHLAEARHIPLGQLTKYLDILPKDKQLLFVCRSGVRSAIATSVLQAHGFSEVSNLCGGLMSWRQAGLPFITE